MLKKLRLLTAMLFAVFALPAMAAEVAVDQKKLNDDLAYQAYFGTSDAALKLIEQGANPDATNAKGVPALSLAAGRKTADGLAVIKALLGNGADKNAPDTDGQTPLFYAAKAGNLEAVKLLLDVGVDYYKQDNSGNIARNLAYTEGHKEVFEYMDGYVNARREAVLQTYKDMDSSLRHKEQELKKIEARQQQTAKALEAASASAAQASASTSGKGEKPTTPTENASETPFDEAHFARVVHDASYHACAYQYWFYVNSVQMKTSLAADTLAEEMQKHKSLSDAASAMLFKQYHATGDYVKKITVPSQQRISQELDRMGSNITRNSHGVGEVTDMEKRCSIIANGWMLDAPIRPKKAEAAAETMPSPVAPKTDIPEVTTTKPPVAPIAPEVAPVKPTEFKEL